MAAMAIGSLEFWCIIGERVADDDEIERPTHGKT